MKPGLSLRVSQHLALTPQLQQSIRLLQLSTLELAQEVEQMLDENPFLEVDADHPPQEDFGLPQADALKQDDGFEADFASVSIADNPRQSSQEAEFDGSDSTSAPSNSDDAPNWEGDGTVEVKPDDAEWGSDAPSAKSKDDDGEFDSMSLAHVHESLPEHLHRQALGLRLGAEDKAALHFLIESLNDDGYLEESLDSLARGLMKSDDQEMLEALLHHFTVALRLLQNMDPTGVGAHDLGECLRLQLRERMAELEADGGSDAVRTAMAICSQPLDLLARRDVRRLAQQCSANETLIKAALALIARLEPRPGRRFVEVERNFIQPDVIVSAIRASNMGQARFSVRLNPDVMPKLRVHDIYSNAIKQGRGGDHQGLSQRLQEARWFIKNIQQRFDTILRVSSAIVERQKNFFVHGELAMRPLVLREIADELGLHESTISRVTTAKYMATPQGTFELKYFFGSGLGTETGGNASSTAVRALIKQFVSAESTKKPLSDSQISDMLKEQGIECARRTVAKYREALKIAPTNLRKAL